MKPRLTSLVPLLGALVLCAPSDAGRISESDRANALFEQFFDEQLRLSPMSQSQLGLKWDYDRWDNVSKAGIHRLVESYERSLQTLREEIDYDQLDEQTRLSYDLWVEEAEMMIDNERFVMHSYLLNQMFGWQSRIPSFLIGIHQIQSEADAEAYVARLRRVRPLIRQIIDLVDEQAQLGLLPPKFVFDLVRSDSRNVIAGQPFEPEGAESTLMEDFGRKVEALDLGEKETEGLLSDAKEALLDSVGPAYRDLLERIDVWQAQAPTEDGVWRMPDGEAFYNFSLRVSTTTDLTADEIHEIGLREVERIHGEMLEIMRKVGFEGTLKEFFEFMRDAPRFYYENTPEGKQRYLREAIAIIDSMRTHLPELFLTLPKASIEVWAVEPFREATAGKAFYERPTPDGSRPGIYYANLYDMANMPTYEMEALAYHEGIPGHHMQIAIMQELEGLPRFRRFGGHVAYIEGWGLYAELLPREIGFYSDPYSEFGQLTMELWRACRLVVDTGIHHKRWSREEAIEYLIENTPNPLGDIKNAADRYVVLPGQATAYMLGMLKIKELRQRAQDALGDAFDVRQFHDEVLRNGSLPLTILEKVMDDWIQRQQAG